MTLFSELGNRVEVRVDGDGLTIAEARQILNFTGRPIPLYFTASMPRWSARVKFFVTVRLFQRGIPIGRSTFAIERGKARTSQTGPTHATRYRHAFLSYANPDRVKVLEIAQAFTRTGINVFQDVLSLEPGERWEQKLFRKIDYADLFMLFWSSAARNSEWVIREAEYALDRRKRFGGRLPEPTPLQRPDPVCHHCRTALTRRWVTSRVLVGGQAMLQLLEPLRVIYSVCQTSVLEQSAR
jgi:hypothetical protein